MAKGDTRGKAKQKVTLCKHSTDLLYHIVTHKMEHQVMQNGEKGLEKRHLRRHNRELWLTLRGV